MGITLVVVVYLWHQLSHEGPNDLLYNFNFDPESFLHLSSAGLSVLILLQLDHKRVHPEQLTPPEHLRLLNKSVQVIHSVQEPLLFQCLVSIFESWHRVGLPVFFAQFAVFLALVDSKGEYLVHLADRELLEAPETSGDLNVLVDTIVLGSRNHVSLESCSEREYSRGCPTPGL